jgi:hypothetical protein
MLTAMNHREILTKIRTGKPREVRAALRELASDASLAAGKRVLPALLALGDRIVGQPRWRLVFEELFEILNHGPIQKFGKAERRKVGRLVARGLESPPSDRFLRHIPGLRWLGREGIEVAGRHLRASLRPRTSDARQIARRYLETISAISDSADAATLVLGDEPWTDDDVWQFLLVLGFKLDSVSPEIYSFDLGNAVAFVGRSRLIRALLSRLRAVSATWRRR